MNKENKKIGNKIQEFCSKYIMLIVAILVFIIGIVSIFITAYFDGDFTNAVEKTSYRIDNIFINIGTIFVLLSFLYIIYKLTKKVSLKILIPVTLAITFIAQILWVNNVKLMPESDQGNIMIGAEAFCNGTFGNLMKEGEYFNIYPFQTALSFYVSIIHKIINMHGYMPIEYINVALSTFNLFMMYLIIALFWKNERIKRTGLFTLFGFSLYFLFFNVHFYGNIIGLTFGLIALYFTLKYLRNKKIYNIIITGIAITLSILFKSNYSIFLCGIILTLVLELLKDKKIRTFASIIIILGTYIILNTGFNFYIEKITGEKISKGVPMISYMYMGIAEPLNLSSGWYTADVVKIYENNNYDYESSSEESKELLKERINYLAQNPGYTIKYFGDKLRIYLAKSNISNSLVFMARG